MPSRGRRGSGERWHAGKPPAFSLPVFSHSKDHSLVAIHIDHGALKPLPEVVLDGAADVQRANAFFRRLADKFPSARIWNRIVELPNVVGSRSAWMPTFNRKDGS